MLDQVHVILLKTQRREILSRVVLVSYSAHVYRILIASPSDVEEEREIVVSAIQAWNDLHSSEKKIVLLPLRAETHSTPELGNRPQEIINKQVVDLCDLLVGVFWTRLGSPTGKADSGTLEEIERVAEQGKPIMLYFSKVKVDVSEVDLDQVKKLKEFKAKTYPKGLVETYSTTLEFRDKFSKQLEFQLRSLVSEGAETDLPVSGNGPDIKLELADPLTDELLGQEVSIKTQYISYQEES